MARFNQAACHRWNEGGRLTGGICAAVYTVMALFISTANAEQSDSVLRVCADPSNMPLSNKQGEGYENAIAEQLAKDLGRKVEYTFFPQRMGFVRNTLRQKDETTREFRCDVIIGVPKGYELTATTQPYMRSTYALIYVQREGLGELKTANDLLKLPPDRLRTLRVGVFGRSPGADWLLLNNLMERAVLYAPQSGDPAENPAHTVEQDLINGKIDAAIVWGPIAGYLASRHTSFPAWRAAPFLPDKTIKFDYEMSMGVRFGEKAWKDTLDGWIRDHDSDVRKILASYRVPLLDADGNLIVSTDVAEKARAGAVRKQIPLSLESQ